MPADLGRSSELPDSTPSKILKILNECKFHLSVLPPQVAEKVSNYEQSRHDCQAYGCQRAVLEDIPIAQSLPLYGGHKT